MVPENVAADKLAIFLEFKNRLARHVQDMYKKPYTFLLRSRRNLAPTIALGENGASKFFPLVQSARLDRADRLFSFLSFS
jgi:hypothetical protein